MIRQTEIILSPYPRGIHLITEEIISSIPSLPETGILNLFIRHTSAALAINENADPSVRHDMKVFFDNLVPENADYFLHTEEGPDDMPSHIKSVIAGISLNIPISRGHLGLGIWQGIYLCEFRNHGGCRRILATIIGE